MSVFNNYRGFFLFFLVCLLSMVSQYLFNTLIVTDDLLYDFYSETVSVERITEILSSRKNYSWPSFVIPPVFFLVKFCLIAVCFSIVALLIGLNLEFTYLFYCATVSELVLVFPSIVKLLWFLFFQTNYTLEDIKYFSPFSVVSFFDFKDLDPLLIYPLRLLNGFEVLYWLSLAFLLKNSLKKDLLGSLSFVASSYGIALLVWVVIVTFISLSLS